LDVAAQEGAAAADTVTEDRTDAAGRHLALDVGITQEAGIVDVVPDAGEAVVADRRPVAAEIGTEEVAGDGISAVEEQAVTIGGIDGHVGHPPAVGVRELV